MTSAIVLRLLRYAKNLTEMLIGHDATRDEHLLPVRLDDSGASCQNVLNDVACQIGEPEIAALKAVGEMFVVDAHQV